MLLIIILLLPLIESYPFGSPACVSKPRHGVDPQETTDVGVEVTKTALQDGSFQVNVTSLSTDNYFRGLLAQTKSVGEFLPGENLNVLECTGFLGSRGPDTKAVTHIDATNKLSVTIEFKPDEGALQEPIFEIIVLKNFTTFWTGLTV